jgi:hypothetical protein
VIDMSDAPVSSSGPTGADPQGIDEDAEPMSFGRRASRILALVVALAVAVLWIYALWGPTEKTFPGTLSDPTFAEQAQPVCTAAAARLADLAPAYQSREASARADVIAEANGELGIMLDQLDQIAPAADSGEDGRMIQEWLGDWRTYLADRERYVVALEADPNARFYVSEKDRRQVTEPIDFFAGRANEAMDNCVTPGDLA